MSMTLSVRKEDTRSAPCAAAPFLKPKKVVDPVVISAPLPSEEDEDVVKAIIAATTPFYSLESKLGDYCRADAIRMEDLQRITDKSLDGLPLVGSNYDSIWGSAGRCPLIPTDIIVPFFLEHREYSVPMATTDGCLAASTTNGCKAILLRDDMKRRHDRGFDLVMRFGTVRRAFDLKLFLNLFDWDAHTSLKSTRPAKFQLALQVSCAFTVKWFSKPWVPALKLGNLSLYKGLEASTSAREVRLTEEELGRPYGQNWASGKLSEQISSLISITISTILLTQIVINLNSHIRSNSKFSHLIQLQTPNTVHNY
ncbi:hypothetical protein RJ639_019647 [Escallonia herrerae]|uniref:Uncharacterized protein n=1 Tax=Escallonia herrerae TaxID=1293975 RepID=A0AA89AI58_9ASTE|nr:hypothetical protein RJ639_019647 [Escallonia herrerae]